MPELSKIDHPDERFPCEWPVGGLTAQGFAGFIAPTSQ